MKLVFYTQIINGEFFFPKNPTTKKFLEFNEGKKFIHEVEEDKPKRTSSQNNLYWKFLTLIEDETGNLADDLHKIAKGKFLAPRQVSVFGSKYTLSATSTKLSKHEFSNYLDKISAWSGVPIPDTEEYNRARGKVEYPTDYQPTAFDV